ncbi:Zinc metalloproteinase nas-13 [Toxocara canis]|uniref:Metalloendopeptidase n=1 Tax=Toxocara canis TaxID=6265 RepID=A0A0B2UYM3_TOXCA|nr:Zinc metalloproteinase nas-13 [Toxocara canis]
MKTWRKHENCQQEIRYKLLAQSATPKILLATTMWLAILLLLQLTSASCKNELLGKSVTGSETFLTEEDFKRAKLIKHNDSEVIDDSELYNPDLPEGDIGSIPSSLSLSSGSNRMKRNAIRLQSRRWPNGRVPYAISDRYDAYSKAIIAAAIAEIQGYTCIRIEPRTAADTDYVFIAPINHCSSEVGRIGGLQYLSLTSHCLHMGSILHEFMHALGFFHEHVRADRDNYVDIHWANIYPPRYDAFRMQTLGDIDHLDTPYDYNSIMHYPSTAFTINGQATIVPKQSGVSIGQRIGFSATDLLKINRLYNCLSGDTTTTTEPTTTTVTTTTKCEDASDKCAGILSSGKCESKVMANFVRKNCARTCNKC